jgi:hypothetical protein
MPKEASGDWSSDVCSSDLVCVCPKCLRDKKPFEEYLEKS